MRDGSLNRTRLAAGSIGGVATLVQLGQLGNPLRSAAYVRLAGACILAIFVILMFTLLQVRGHWWTAPLVPVLVAIGGSGLQDPVAGVALATGSTVVLSLYESTWRLWTVRVVGALIAVPSALAISPNSVGRTMTWNSPTVIGVLPQLVLIFVLMRGIYLALLRQERTAKRERVLARAGHAMIGVTDLGQVHQISQQSADELIALTPGVALLSLRRDAGGFRITHVVGAPDEFVGRCVRTEPAALAALLPGFCSWVLDWLGADPATADTAIAVGGRRTARPEVVDALRTLANQTVLASRSCRVHAELDHLAHHDHLTELPTRAKFFRTLSGALAAQTAGAIALLNVDLDEFKQVNDRYGHGAGDELLLAVATRLAEVAEVADGRGLAGRFGGDEFALLLTELTDADGAGEIARQLSARLAEPVRLTAATVTVGASIGIAVAEPGISVAELTRRADVAMYAAKAAGKNRIEIFPGFVAAHR